MTDSGSRRAAWLAAAAAIPIALVVGVVVFTTYHSRMRDTASTAAASPSAAPSPATGPVTLPVRTLPAAEKQMCLAFVAALPTALPSARPPAPERHVSAGGAQQNAAFGDPPITAQCGVTEPSVAPTAEIYPISGVCWYAQTTATGTEWTTLDRVAPVRVTVPKSYSGPGQWANQFRDAIVLALPSKKTPYNC